MVLGVPARLITAPVILTEVEIPPRAVGDLGIVGGLHRLDDQVDQIFGRGLQVDDPLAAHRAGDVEDQGDLDIPRRPVDLRNGPPTGR
ncbi:hypothetical protein GMDG_08996 [Pseudogymnoascus destructans 20631-21]|uniref:Uncharacterized protein n=1 Tax=Pseudogymnoascus destructans (strain ATCC MYA-4855 / 20631-21) TaxID=658429 RepID=L8FUN9_PSED2|nr:hypothetical protein GMDG_08996 [Pseudogymnoascus destructans 20631-21]